MKIHAVICTRSSDLTRTTQELLDTLSSFGVETKVMVNQSSIFDAYKKGLDKCNAAGNDIIVFCHDDIELLDSKAEFIAKLAVCVNPKVGIVGPAGTTLLGRDAIWWDHQRWQAGLHSGAVYHRDKAGTTYPTEYGPHRQVVALDGLFLAAQKDVWEAVGLSKPEFFEGKWDFYDIYYTTRAHSLGYENQTIPLQIIHHSGGELVGRDSWFLNKSAFINRTELPIQC